MLALYAIGYAKSEDKWGRTTWINRKQKMHHLLKPIAAEATLNLG